MSIGGAYGWLSVFHPKDARAQADRNQRNGHRDKSAKMWRSQRDDLDCERSNYRQ
jgi:hypothetical protein